MYPVSKGHYFQLPTSLNFSIFICIYLFQYLAHNKITCLAKRHTDVYILHKLTNINMQMMRKGMVTIQVLLFISISLAWFNIKYLKVSMLFPNQCSILYFINCISFIFFPRLYMYLNLLLYNLDLCVCRGYFFLAMLWVHNCFDNYN